ncbi:hypothetical protein EIP91_003116 [Steccherinum ochraceum]|uniref:HD domain-containing protein n=1 Tax=Steccherinum ochraceum TaxID=92696 RepID=A0A4R0RVQ0_9APHY|nr:hypothetical protein EIP91_003116 [Steccherinum ochraceum]
MIATEAAAKQAVQKRVFPPLYKSSGDVSQDRLAFFHILERLKTQKRTGWVNHNVPGPESISDHMYRMAMLAMCTSDEHLDVSKCIMMSVVHDLAEAQVGDITPSEGIPKAEKRRLEAEAMHNFVHEMLHDSPAAQRIVSLWQEYEDGATAEARFIWIDSRWHLKVRERLAMNTERSFIIVCPALEYERNHGIQTLQPFFDSSLPSLRHPEVKQWGEDLAAERERFKQSQQQGSKK